MRLRLLDRTMVIGLLVPFCLWGVTIRECPRGKVTAESYTLDFVAEANRLFDELGASNQSLMYTSDRLTSVNRVPGQVSWQTHARRLMKAREDVNRMNEIVCRLETIKPAVDPWQAGLIDRLRGEAVLSAVHVEGAIDYFNENTTRIEEIGSPVYAKHVEVVYDLSRDLDKKLDAYTTLAAAEARVHAIESETIG